GVWRGRGEAGGRQAPGAVRAVRLAEVKGRIVNGRRLRPLEEVVRRLPPDVFGPWLGRGPVEVPGMESFPAPFKPQAGSAPAAPPPAASRAANLFSHVESATIEMPSADQVAAGPASAPAEAAGAYQEAARPPPAAP